MKFNLAGIKLQENQQNQISPIDIFKVLPKKNKKYSYLRDVQADVLEAWFAKKGENEVVIKMNTGSGKTVVSLLILASCMKLDMGPVVYVVPDNYLRSQVQKEALDLGIEITVDTEDISFRRQKSILLVNIHKLFNGYSVFGVGREGSKIDVGTFLIDDVHACIDKIEDQFTLSINRKDKEIYAPLFDIFKHELRNQAETVYTDIEEGKPETFLQVPFWTIQKNAQEIINIMSASEQTDSDIKWKLPLVKEYLKYCDCVVADDAIEFSLRVIPTEIISSYVTAKKILVSATLPDDTILTRYLNISQQAINNTITPKTAGDIGERLIIVPEAVNTSITKDVIKNMVREYLPNYKIVVIVPSNYRADYWRDIASDVITSSNIENGLETFKQQQAGLVVFVNKYDGIDLPDDDCRILIIDELPEDRSKIEKVDINVLGINNNILMRKMRKIEQGMGRAVRSNEDYSVVFLLGKSLTNYLYSKREKGFEHFTPATQRQMTASDDLVSQIQRGTIDDIKDAVNLVLCRNTEWVTAIKSSLLGLMFTPQIPNTISFTLSSAFKCAWKGQIDDAVKVIETFCQTETNVNIKAWMKYYAALFANLLNPSDAQEILKSACSLNSKLVRPLNGIQYKKLSTISNQVDRCITYFNQYSQNINNLILHLNVIMEKLDFIPNTANSFENAIMELGELIGFDSQRPENDYGKGPDNLWACGELKYFVIECKNGCKKETINKSDINQINGSAIWFRNHYDGAGSCIPIIIHPGVVPEHAASPNPELRVINKAKLEELKSSVYTFITSLANSNQLLNKDRIKQVLQNNKLMPDLFIQTFTLAIKPQ
jgi:hypothetical protein